MELYWLSVLVLFSSFCTFICLVKTNMIKWIVCRYIIARNWHHYAKN